MKFLPLLWAGLRRKPLRTLYTLASIIIAFVLIGIMTGVNAGFAQMIEKAPQDRIVVLARFGVWMPLAHVEQVARIDGVRQIDLAAFMSGSYQNPEKRIGIAMVDARTAQVRPELNLTPELFARLERVRNGVVISRSAANRLGWREGETYPLETDRITHDGTRNWMFNVVGVVPDPETWPDMAVGNYAYLNEGRADRRDEIHEIQLRIADPASADATSGAIERLFANSTAPVTALPQRTQIANSIQGFLDMQFLTWAISAAALFMILFLTGNVMAQSVRERIPELAVMKALGFSDRGIFALVLGEAAALCLAGAAIGLLASKGASALAQVVLEGAPQPIITAGVIGFAVACALFVALVSGLPAAWRVQRLTIAEALGGR